MPVMTGLMHLLQISKNRAGADLVSSIIQNKQENCYLFRGCQTLPKQKTKW